MALDIMQRMSTYGAMKAQIAVFIGRPTEGVPSGMTQTETHDVDCGVGRKKLIKDGWSSE